MTITRDSSFGGKGVEMYQFVISFKTKKTNRFNDRLLDN
jgi:hypothetical protein